MTTQTVRPSKALVQCLNVQALTCVLFGVSAWLVSDVGRISGGRVELYIPWFLDLRYVAAAGVLASLAAFGWMTMSLVRPDASSDRRLQTVAVSLLTAAGVLLLATTWIAVDFMVAGVPGTMSLAP